MKKASSEYADKIFKQNLMKISILGNNDENPRPKYADGTPAHSKYITDEKVKFNIQNGQLPFSTLRNVAVKTGIKEIMWIYQKQTSSLDVAENMKICWWNEWNVGDGTIGQRYGATVHRYNIINNVLNSMIKDPFSRRHIINLWQEQDFKDTDGLLPCMYNVTFMIRKVGKKYLIDTMMKQR